MNSDTVNLLSLVLTLRPIPKTPTSEPLPRWWGRAAHALLLDTVRQYDPSLAESLHTPNQQGQSSPARPVTATTLMGRFPNGALDPDGSYTLRLTSLTRKLASILIQASQDGPLAPGASLELDYLPFRVERLAPFLLAGDKPDFDSETSPWAASTSYQDLSAPYLLAKRIPDRRITFQFTSPTTFKSGGKHVPIPLPELVFGGLLTRWNAFAPIVFPPEVRRYAEECLAISRYKLSSRSVPIKGRGRRMGGVGQVTFTSLNFDRYWMSVLHTLASFALFSGVGAGASMGLGQCRIIRQADS